MVLSGLVFRLCFVFECCDLFGLFCGCFRLACWFSSSYCSLCGCARGLVVLRLIDLLACCCSAGLGVYVVCFVLGYSLIVYVCFVDAVWGCP